MQTLAESAFAHPAVPFESEGLDPFDEYEENCGAGTLAEADADACEVLLAIIRHRTLEALESLQYTRDRRAVEEALLALELDGEPEIQTEACRILGYFAAEDERIYPALLPLLNSPYLATQRIVAMALERSDDDGLSRIGGQWRRNHQGFLPTRLRLQQLRGPESVRRLRPEPYPGSGLYSPANSNQSLGWASKDSLDTVVGHFARLLGRPALTASEWQAEANASSEALVMATAQDQGSVMAELQALAEKFQQTNDPALLQQIEEISQRLDEGFQETERKIEGSLLQIETPPPGSPASTRNSARFFVLEEQGGRMNAVLAVYREEAFGQTVIQFLWDEQVFGPTVLLGREGFQPD